MIGEMEREGSGVRLGCRERFGEIEVGSGERKVGSGERKVGGFVLAKEGSNGVQGCCGVQWGSTEGSSGHGGRCPRRVSREV